MPLKIYLDKRRASPFEDRVNRRHREGAGLHIGVAGNPIRTVSAHCEDGIPMPPTKHDLVNLHQINEFACIDISS